MLKKIVPPTCCILLIGLFYCAGKKQVDKTQLNGETTSAPSPVSYQPTALGQQTKVIYDQEADTLFLLHVINVSQDSLIKMDYLFSNVEIITHRDSLLKRYCKSALDANSLCQILSLKNLENDSFKVNTWGFGYSIKESQKTKAKQNMLYFTTSTMFEQTFPVKRCE